MDNLTERYIDLAAAVVLKAVEDYKIALRRLKKDDERKSLYKYKAKELERFFLSEYGQMLSAHNGQRLIEKCRKEIDEEVT